MSCDAHGGDIVAFVRLRHGLDFKRAAQSLGCWKDGGLSAADRQRIERERFDREQKRLAQEAAEAEQKRQRIEVCGNLHTLEQIEREVSRTMLQRYKEDGDLLGMERDWEALALLCDPIRELDHKYRELAGLADEQSSRGAWRQPLAIGATA